MGNEINFGYQGIRKSVTGKSGDSEIRQEKKKKEVTFKDLKDLAMLPMAIMAWPLLIAGCEVPSDLDKLKEMADELYYDGQYEEAAELYLQFLMESERTGEYLLLREQAVARMFVCIKNLILGEMPVEDKISLLSNDACQQLEKFMMDNYHYKAGDLVELYHLVIDDARYEQGLSGHIDNVLALVSRIASICEKTSVMKIDEYFTVNFDTYKTITENLHVNRVSSEKEEGFRQALDFVRKIASYLGWGQKQDIYSAILKAMLESGIPIDPGLVCECLAAFVSSGGAVNINDFESYINLLDEDGRNGFLLLVQNIISSEDIEELKGLIVADIAEDADIAEGEDAFEADAGVVEDAAGPENVTYGAQDLFNEAKDLYDAFDYGKSVEKLTFLINGCENGNENITGCEDQEVIHGAKYYLGKSYYAIGFFEEALNALEDILDDDYVSGYSDDAQYYLGFFNYEYRKFETAIVEFNKVLTDYPDSQYVDNAMYYIGVCYLELGDYEAARTMFERVVAEYGNGSQFSGWAQDKLSEIDAILASSQADGGSVIEPDAGVADAGPAAEDIAQTDIARTDLPQEDMQADAVNIEVVVNAIRDEAEVALNNQDYEGAIILFKQIIDEYPDYPYLDQVYIDLAEAYEAVGDYMQAAAAWGVYVSKFPDNPYAEQALLREIDNLLEIDELDLVKDLYGQYLEKYPGGTAVETATISLEQIPLLLEAKEAVTYYSYSRGVDILSEMVAPDYGLLADFKAFANYYLGKGYSSLARYEESIPYLESVEGFPNGRTIKDDAIYDCGWSYYCVLDYTNAKAKFEEYLEQYPDGKWADLSQYYVGVCYYELEEYPTALMEFQKYFDTNEDPSSSAYYFISKCYYELGYCQEAKENLEYYLENVPGGPMTGACRTLLTDVENDLQDGVCDGPTN